MENEDGIENELRRSAHRLASAIPVTRASLLVYLADESGLPEARCDVILGDSLIAMEVAGVEYAVPPDFAGWDPDKRSWAPDLLGACLSRHIPEEATRLMERYRVIEDDLVMFFSCKYDIAEDRARELVRKALSEEEYCSGWQFRFISADDPAGVGDGGRYLRPRDMDEAEWRSRIASRQESLRFLATDARLRIWLIAREATCLTRALRLTMDELVACLSFRFNLSERVVADVITGFCLQPYPAGPGGCMRPPGMSLGLWFSLAACREESLRWFRHTVPMSGAFAKLRGRLDMAKHDPDSDRIPRPRVTTPLILEGTTRVEIEGMTYEMPNLSGAKVTIEGGDDIYDDFTCGVDPVCLRTHPCVRAASQHAMRSFGVGTGRPGAHGTPLAGLFENRIAAFLEMPAAMLFQSEYAACLATMSRLLDEEAFLVTDCPHKRGFVDGARLAGATVGVFQRNDDKDLARVLDRISRERGKDTLRNSEGRPLSLCRS